MFSVDSQPHEPVRCSDCGRLIPKGPVIAGRGTRCADQAGLVPHRVRLPAPRRRESTDGPTLFDHINEGEMTMSELTTIDALIGDDDTKGILDDYKIEMMTPEGNHPIVVWRCERDCGNGNGSVGVIARNLDLDQTNLTLGELVESALRHGREEHGEKEINHG